MIRFITEHELLIHEAQLSSSGADNKHTNSPNCNIIDHQRSPLASINVNLLSEPQT